MKPPLRFPHAPQNSPLKVPKPPEGVPEGAPQVQGHGVDGKIPAPQILLQRVRKSDRLRPAMVAVRSILSEGGYLHRLVLRADGDCSVLQPRGDSPFTEQGHGLLRKGGGGHIPVHRRPAQPQVPDAAPHAPGLVAGGLQGTQKIFHKFRDFCHTSSRF